MTFLWRDALWLMFAPPILLASYFALLKRARYTVRYSSVRLIAEAQSPLQRLRRHIPPILFLLAVVALLAAVARPAAFIALPTEQRLIVLAIDVSLSMSADDVAPSRIAAAQAAAKRFVAAQPRDVRIAIVAFAGDADMVLAPTRSRDDARAAIDRLELRYNTAIGSGVLAAVMTVFPHADFGADYDIFGFGRSPAEPRPVGRNQKPAPRVKMPAVAPASHRSAAIVLLTDGRETIGMRYEKAAQIAAAHGLRIYTVGFGSASETKLEIDGVSMDVSFDEVALKEIAETTHAAYHHASTAAELNRVYQTLSGEIVLERKQRELTVLLTMIAVLLLLASGGLSLAWSGRLV